MIHPESTADSALTTTPAVRLRPLVLAFAFTAAAATGNLLFSNEWCCAVVPVGAIAFAFAVITHVLATKESRRTSRSRQRWVFLIVVAAGLSIGAGLRVRSDWAFEETFGFSMPAEIHDFRVLARHYEGGPGEHTLITEFHAAPAVFETIVARAGLTDDTEDIRTWTANGASWSAISDTFLHSGPSGLSARSWKRVAPMSKPHIYQGETRNGWSTIIRDQDSGRVVAAHCRY